VDFVVNRGMQRYYIQSALHIEDEDKRIHETNSLSRINDSYKKVVVVKDDIIPWRDEKGILYVGIREFLLDDRSLEL
jgi:predicted AAA+ superfamily ATPase